MDWANDNVCLAQSRSDLNHIFKYEQSPTTVVKVAEDNGYEAQIWILRTHEEWVEWLAKHTCQRFRGLIWILADPADRNSFRNVMSMPMSVTDWLTMVEESIFQRSDIRRAATFGQLGDKPSPNKTTVGSLPQIHRKPRSIRKLPFSQSTFECICESLQVHRSIVRTLARVDIPSFTCESVVMKKPSIVYNCRTPNSWDEDIALSSTYYPEDEMTFAILYGSSFQTEKAILERLRFLTVEAAHPLLLPGILAELELRRHTRLVESSVIEVEAKIFELNFQPREAQDFDRSKAEAQNQAKRSAWLDLTYLRNSLITWSTQLLKIAEHAEDLNRRFLTRQNQTVASSPVPSRLSECPCDKCVRFRARQSNMAKHESETSESLPRNDALCALLYHCQAGDSEEFGFLTQDQKEPVLRRASDSPIRNIVVDGDTHSRKLVDIGSKIICRISAIRDEYDEKVRDCTMRVDGMAMATQWSQSETAVEIALATNQDSRVTRSISLVTMVFLPGTFFATVFSMTFFNWSGKEGAQVSQYLWIYVVVTVSFTAMTLGLWYFFVILRGSNRGQKDEEKIVTNLR